MLYPESYTFPRRRSAPVSLQRWAAEERMRTVIPAVLFLIAAACWRGDSNIQFDSPPPSVMGDGIYQYGATIDGKMTWWTVRFADVARTPDWSPGTEPPLSLSQAVQLAINEVPKYTDIPAAYRLDKVEWLNVTNCTPGKKWIYLVSFEREYEYQGRKFASRGTITIPVLLNGGVVQGSKGERPPN